MFSGFLTGFGASSSPQTTQSSTTTEAASPPPNRSRGLSNNLNSAALAANPMNLFVSDSEVLNQVNSYSEIDSDEEYVGLYDDLPRLTTQISSTPSRINSNLPRYTQTNPPDKAKNVNSNFQTNSDSSKPPVASTSKTLRKLSPTRQWGKFPTLQASGSGYGTASQIRQLMTSAPDPVSESTPLFTKKTSPKRVQSPPRQSRQSIPGLREATRIPLSNNLPPPAIGRLISLDMFRGLTVCGMILANYQYEEDCFDFMKHAEWEGITVVDFIFPSFLLICGVSIPLSLHLRPRDRSAVIGRSFILFLIGLLLNNPFANILQSGDLANFRILGVLQRIALVYFVNTLVYMATSWFFFGTVFPILCLCVYLILTFAIPTPCGFGYIRPPGCTSQAYIDQLILGRPHLYQGLEYDPEGIVSTFTAIITCWIGCVLGVVLIKILHDESASEKWKYKVLTQMWGFSLGSIFVGLIIGQVFSEWMPISKKLWTLPFVLITAGFSIGCYSMLFWMVEIEQYVRGEDDGAVGDTSKTTKEAWGIFLAGNGVVI